MINGPQKLLILVWHVFFQKTKLMSTLVLLAPMGTWIMHGHLSAKADVFSFGVLILELISGQKNSTFDVNLDAQSLLEWAWKFYKKNRSLEVLDSSLASSAVAE